jgi:hypothetical protein
MRNFPTINILIRVGHLLHWWTYVHVSWSLSHSSCHGFRKCLRASIHHYGIIKEFILLP